MLKDRVLKFLKLDGLVDGLSGYIETRVSLLKIEVKEEIIELISKILVIHPELFFKNWQMKSLMVKGIEHRKILI